MSNVTVVRIGPVAVVVDNLHKIEPSGQTAIKVTYAHSPTGQPVTEVIQNCSFDQFWAALRSSVTAKTAEVPRD